MNISDCLAFSLFKTLPSCRAFRHSVVNKLDPEAVVKESLDSTHTWDSELSLNLRSLIDSNYAELTDWGRLLTRGPQSGFLVRDAVMD